MVNKVFHLDADRSVLDIYNLGWQAYLEQRETDARRRRRERMNAERQAVALQSQADKMRAKATKARAAQNMQKRAERLLAGVSADRAAGARGQAAVPGSGALRQDAAQRDRAVEVVRLARGVHRRGRRGRPRVAGGGARPERRGKTTLLRLLAGVEEPDTGEVLPGHGLRLGYYAQEHETLDTARTILENMRTAAPDLAESEHRRILGSFLFSGDDVAKPVGVLSGGEKTRLALALLVVSGANVLLLDEPTNNLDPASRAEILSALRTYEGAIVLVTHDEGAVDALQPERVVLLPDGVEDAWSAELADLVALA